MGVKRSEARSIVSFEISLNIICLASVSSRCAQFALVVHAINDKCGRLRLCRCSCSPLSDRSVDGTIFLRFRVQGGGPVLLLDPVAYATARLLSRALADVRSSSVRYCSSSV